MFPFRNIRENQYDAFDLAAINYWGCTGVDRNVAAVLRYEDGVVRKSYDRAGREYLGNWVFDRIVGLFIYYVKDILERGPASGGLLPASQLLGNRIHKCDRALCIRGDNSVADAR